MLASTVVWDSLENLQKVQRTVYFLTKDVSARQGALPDAVSVQKRACSVVLVAIALIVRTQKYSATIREREQERDQEVVDEMKDQGEMVPTSTL